MDDYLVKPINPNALREKLERILSPTPTTAAHSS
jgi:hypothetical protein